MMEDSKQLLTKLREVPATELLHTLSDEEVLALIYSVKDLLGVPREL